MECLVGETDSVISHVLWCMCTKQVSLDIVLSFVVNKYYELLYRQMNRVRVCTKILS